MKKLLVIFFAFWAFFYSNAALAVAGDYWTEGYNQNGTKSLYSTSNLTQAQAQRWLPTYEVLGGGGAKVTVATEAVFGASKAAVAVKGIATGAAILGTAKAILGGPVGVGMTALMLAPALVDWFTTDTTRPGQPSSWASAKPFEMLEGQGCTSQSPCYEYAVDYPGISTTFFSSRNAACSLFASTMSTSSGWSYTMSSSSTESACLLDGYHSTGATRTNYYAASYLVRLLPVTAPSWVPASIDEIRARMEVEPYIPGVIDGLLNAGGSLPIAYAPGDGWSGATGPATTGVSPAVVKSTVAGFAATSASVSSIGGNPYNLANNTPTVTNTVNGTENLVIDGKPVSVPTKHVTTSIYDPATGATTNSTVDATPSYTVSTSSQTKTDLQYGNGTPSGGTTSVPTVTGTTTTTTTTTVTNNVTNNVVNNSTTNENKPLSSTPDPTDLGSITDTAFGAIPALYVRKYPDGLTGVWDAKIAAIKATPLFSLVGNLMPTSIASGGACPTWPINFNFGTWANFGTHDVAPPCWVWDFGRVVIIVSSLLLARALIFGG